MPVAVVAATGLAALRTDARPGEASEDKLIRRSADQIPTPTAEELARLRDRPDEDIDTSDIPPMAGGRRVRRGPDGRILESVGLSEVDPELDPANFEANYPSLKLSPTGEGEDVVIGGMGWAREGLIRDLRHRRQEKGLTIEEVARRSELNEATVSRLENRHIQNPTLDTIFRYAVAMDLLITLGTEEVEEQYRWGSALTPLPPGSESA
jgi:DNA-binding XRE family transcriptional regulator